MADSKIPVSSKVNIDAELLQAYLANNDTRMRRRVAAQIKQLDPNSTAGARKRWPRGLIKAGQAAAGRQKTYETAITDFDQAAAAGDPNPGRHSQHGCRVCNSAEREARLQADAKPMPRRHSLMQPNNAQANFAEGIALTAQWAVNSHDDATKKKAADALGKADQQAKADGNEALSLQIETFAKQESQRGARWPVGRRQITLPGL